jgi:hypothetical protein
LRLSFGNSLWLARRSLANSTGWTGGHPMRVLIALYLIIGIVMLALGFFATGP